ncbi:MAG: ATP-binding protein [Lachnospiraceae bacterium]|nr:ATP-binding protein [Lachnospiraceae bacterium]
MNEKKSGKGNTYKIGLTASGSKPQNMKFCSSQQIMDDYVMIEMGEGEKVVYEVTDVDVYNSRMDDMELVRYILPGEDYTKYNIYRANARPLGLIKNDGLHSIKKWFVAPPGKEVKAVNSCEIAMAYGVEQCEGKEKIGNIIRHKNTDVWLDIPQLLTTHMAVVGRSGQGKSNLAKILLKKLPMKYMVFTKVNEYINISDAKKVDPDYITIDQNISLFKRIFDLNNTEVQYLKEYLKKAECSGKVYTSELAENIRNSFLRDSNKGFQQMELFGNSTQDKSMQIPKFAESLCKKIESISMRISFGKHSEEDKSCIINMQNLSGKEEEIVLYSYLMPLLENRRKYYKNAEQALPLDERIVIFIEEAHNYIPSTKTAFCKDVIQQIAREGRKLGIHLVLLSQRPRFMDPTALSQCGSIVSFNLTNPEDIDYLMQNANFYGDNYKNTISELKIGECTIISDYLRRAISCKVEFY